MPTPDKRYDEEIAQLVAEVRQCQAQISQAEADIEQHKLRLKLLLELRGENWLDEDGYARLVSEGERLAYDAKALDRLMLDDPERYGWLKDYRRKSAVQEHVQVK